MNGFIYRLKVEYQELKSKIDKLEEFLESKRFLELDEIQRNLLNNQIVAMKEYEECLHERLLWLII